MNYKDHKMLKKIIFRLLLRYKRTERYVKKNAWVFYTAAFLFFLTLIVCIRPLLIYKDALKPIKTILANWHNGDLTIPMELWENPETYPKIYDLQKYRIKKLELRKIDKVRYARFLINLQFPEGYILPEDADWVFTLRQGRFRWVVIDFYKYEEDRIFGNNFDFDNAPVRMKEKKSIGASDPIYTGI